MKDRTKKGLLDLLLLLAGTLLLAFAVKCIYEPLDMVTGGFSGLAILIKAVQNIWYRAVSRWEYRHCC